MSEETKQNRIIQSDFRPPWWLKHRHLQTILPSMSWAAGTGLNLRREVQEFYWNFTVSSDLLELRNLVDTASLIVESATRRGESRGLHYTLDHPDRDDENFRRDTVIRR